MERAVEQYCMETKCLEIEKKKILFQTDRLLEQVLSHDVMNVIEQSSVPVNSFVGMNVYDNVSKMYVENFRIVCNLSLSF